ncbi:hypothetical protein PACILC2_11740 [Paenibacillus cisolokensis]|uniref:HTH merR-type domain-containing protein n=1 Tax=Paenibacillus cisolokensis TaxID=1658519 RepID=A0ABQ4N382_9BACL|nr:hypothetical protein PACILC2_11740 [Paenibacillus cisolokensis]
MFRLHRILAYKDLGFTLDQIRTMLDENVSSEQIRGMLRLKKAELQKVLQEETARLARIEERLVQIERGNDTRVLPEAIVKPSESILAASVRDIIPRSQLSDLFDEVVRYVLPEVPSIAALAHQCHLNSICRVDTDLALWIESNGYRISETFPCRETFVLTDEVNRELYVAELQIPVEIG